MFNISNQFLSEIFDGLLDTKEFYSLNLFSPNYPGSYLSNTDMSWEIRTEMEGYVIKVVVFDFSVMG